MTGNTLTVVFDIEKYIRELTWSPHATDMEKTLVAGNLRALYHNLIFNGIPVYVAVNSDGQVLMDGMSQMHGGEALAIYRETRDPGCDSILAGVLMLPAELLELKTPPSEEPRHG